VSNDTAFLAQGRSDPDGRLVSASEPLAGLQLDCGGDILARSIRASNGRELIDAWIEIEPAKDEGCEIRVSSWQVKALPAEDPTLTAEHRAAIDRTLAELSARLDAQQCLLAVDGDAADLGAVIDAMRAGVGQPWTNFVSIEGAAHKQPMHWRLLDGAKIRLSGSERQWRASLLPQQVPGQDPHGYELCLTADMPLPPAAPRALPGSVVLPSNEPGLVGRDIAPVLRQPIARIIANAETIRTRMAGPLADEYSQYAADIAAAGQHLLALVEDLADLEVVEAEEFNTAPDRIDLADVAQRAAGILNVRAQERGITIDAPRAGEHLPAIAEFRRVLQVLLNLVGNAIRYSPDKSQIWIRLEDAGGRARLIVADQGPGLSEEQQARVFEKFERLGRSGEDGGSGLGLYISRRLARAMGGDLTVESAPGQGARFILEVPADLLALAPTTTQNPD
jgi:Histidine kinase-, DNA gyrase B-, and HSP90-like ATPase/His Kinase A (phospho-acceptor) domain